MAFKENSRDYIYDDFKDSKESLDTEFSQNNNFFLIYDPIIETEEEILGGPWCFSISGKRAYLAFSSYSLAEEFANLWKSSKNYEVIKIDKINSELYQELLDNVDHLLILTELEDIENLITNVDEFPYDFHLVRRDKYLIH